jgi:hypothetical protein
MSKMEEMGKIYQLEVALRISDQFEITQSDLNGEVKFAHTQGWKDCLKHDESVKKLVEALDRLQAGFAGMFGYQEVTALQDFYDRGEEIVNEALSKFREKVGE